MPRGDAGQAIAAGGVELRLGQPFGVAQVGAGDVGAAEIHARDVGAGEVGVAEIGAARVGVRERRVLEDGARTGGLDQLDVARDPRR